MRDRHCGALTAIVGLGLVLALGVAIANRADTPSDLRNDELGYYNLASSLLLEHSYPSSYWPPAYPVFVAIVRAVAGPAPIAVYVAQALLFAVTLLLVHRIALHITDSKATALVTAGLCAIWPPFFLAAGDVLSELLASFLIAAALWALVVAIQRGSLAASAAAGLLTGLAVLTKSVVLAYVPLAALFAAGFRGARLRRALLALALLAAVAVSLVPWTIRNYVIWGELIPVCTGGGFNFWLGNWPDYYQTVWVWEDYPEDIREKVEGKSAPERDRILVREGVRCIVEDPVRAAGIFALKFSELWLGGIGRDPRGSADSIPSIGRFGLPVQSLVCTPLFVLMILGWVSLEGDARRRARPVLALLTLWTLVFVATTVAPTRYVIPVQFYQMLLVSVVITRVARPTPHARRR